MKTKTTISELTREDLVNLFSTALYGSYYLSADWDDDLPTDEDSCYEETLADILLAGGKVYFKDHYANGEKFRRWAYFDAQKNAIYPIQLSDVRIGLERAANGDFHAGSGSQRESTLNFARQAFNAFLTEGNAWDYITGDALMQIILFDEIIYG